MMPVYVQGVGIVGPGLPNWSQARPILAGTAAYSDTGLPRLSPALLSPDLRRRAGDHIRIAIEVATEAVSHAGVAAENLPSVFATSESDGQVTHAICEAIVQPQPAVSPTRFHNSVTNAAAGYWSMAVQCLRPSTSVAGFDASFGVGLLEACTQVLTDADAVLLVAHDTRLPEPLNGVRPMLASFGTALILTRRAAERSLAQLEVSVAPTAAHTRMTQAPLEQLRCGNPAARALPLLAALAAGGQVEVVVPYLEGQALRIGVRPHTDRGAAGE